MSENDKMEIAKEMIQEHLFSASNLRCRDCGYPMDPDQEACVNCGWKNPMVEFGFI